MALTTCVVIGTYNGAAYLTEQFVSLLNQCICPDIIVARDDASTDGTLSILLDLSRKSEIPTKVIPGKVNIGYVANFSAALAMADADIYFFCDQDDVWLPQKIERHLEIYRNDPDALLIVSNQEIVGPQLERSGRTTLDEIVARRGDDTQFVHGCCTSFRRSLHKLAIEPRAGLAHDDWIHTIADLCDGRRVLNTPLQLFRRHGANTTSSDFNAFRRNDRRRRWSTCVDVATNLETKAHQLRQIAIALKSAHDLPTEVARKGYCRAAQLADDLESRAKPLRMGYPGISLIVKEFLAGKRTFRKSINDILRLSVSMKKGSN